MNITRERQLKDIKGLVGQFQEEVKSNSVTDLVTWLECKMEYQDNLEKTMKKRQIKGEIKNGTDKKTIQHRWNETRAD